MALTNVTFMVVVRQIRRKAVPKNDSLEFIRKKTPFLHKQEKRNIYGVMAEHLRLY